MNKENMLTIEIEDLRMALEAAIREEKELIDPEVIKASQSLDKVMIQYYRMLRMGGLRILNEGVK